MSRRYSQYVMYLQGNIDYSHVRTSFCLVRYYFKMYFIQNNDRFSKYLKYTLKKTCKNCIGIKLFGALLNIIETS